MTTMETTDGRSVIAARVVAALSALLAIGAALLAIGHAGVSIPFVSGLGPGGSRIVAQAATAFTIATVLAALVAVGAMRRRPWAWALGLVLHAFVVLGSAMPYRGTGSAVGIGLGVIALAVLVSRPGRDAFLSRASD